jgi:hypothetical protein
MADLKPESRVPTSVEHSISVNPSKTDSAAALSQQCWERDHCNPKTLTPAEARALHDLGESDIKDAFAEFYHNPPPAAWQYDSRGNLLEAGDRVKATYDQNGQLQKAQIDGNTYEKVGDSVVETYLGNDGKPHTYTIQGIGDFRLSTVDGNFHGAYKSVDLEAKTANGGGIAEIAKIWESPAHSAFVADFWKKEHQ